MKVFVDPALVLRCAQCQDKIDFTATLPLTVLPACTPTCMERLANRLVLQGFGEYDDFKANHYTSRWGCDCLRTFRRPDPESERGKWERKFIIFFA